MQISLNIKNENVLDKLLWMLEHFKSDGVEIVNSTKTRENSLPLSDKYISENWKELVSNGLESYDDAYYKSDQYKMDKGAYLMEKYR